MDDHSLKPTYCSDRNDLLLQAIQEVADSGNSLNSSNHSCIESSVCKLAQSVLELNNELHSHPIVIITPELGKWSTVGGLGVMVDNLSKALAQQGQQVIVISPYYDRNRYGQVEYDYERIIRV